MSRKRRTRGSSDWSALKGCLARRKRLKKKALRLHPHRAVEWRHGELVFLDGDLTGRSDHLVLRGRGMPVPGIPEILRPGAKEVSPPVTRRSVQPKPAEKRPSPPEVIRRDWRFWR